MKRYEVLILLVLLIFLLVVLLKMSNVRTINALDEFNKCKVILDHDCLEYGNCRCR